MMRSACELLRDRLPSAQSPADNLTYLLSCIKEARHGHRHHHAFQQGQARLETDDTLREDAEAVSIALDWYTRGADLADALHLAACGSTVMHTFDRGFCKAARDAGIAPEVRVWEV